MIIFLKFELLFIDNIFIQVINSNFWATLQLLFGSFYLKETLHYIVIVWLGWAWLVKRRVPGAWNVVFVYFTIFHWFDIINTSPPLQKKTLFMFMSSSFSIYKWGRLRPSRFIVPVGACQLNTLLSRHWELHCWH